MPVRGYKCCRWVFLGLQKVCALCQLACLIRTEYICDSHSCPVLLGVCYRGIGEGEMNTTEGLELDSKTQGFKLLGGLMLDILMDMNVESPGAQCEGTDEF